MNTETNDPKKPMIGGYLPVAILIVGFVLLVLNIVIEDEPGAVPLFIILVSGGWLIVRYVKLRLQKRNA